MDTNEFYEFIQQNCATGEVMRFAYAGGHSRDERQGAFLSLAIDNLRVEHEGEIAKTYKVYKLLWAANSKTKAINDNCLEETVRPPSPYRNCQTLADFSRLVKEELTSRGLTIHESEFEFGVSIPYKNGKPKRNPKFFIQWQDRSKILISDGEEIVEAPVELTSNERPWYVSDVPRSKTFKNLSDACNYFMTLIKQA